MKSKKLATILIVDDTPNNLQILSIMLETQGYQVKKAISGKFALQGVKLAKPDLILLDVYMPEIDGYDVCRELKSMSETKSIPVIFISASDNVADKVKAFEVGGVDYITKPFQAEEVLIRVSNHLALRSLSQQLQEQNALMQQEINQLQKSEAREREKVQKLEMLLEELKNAQAQLHHLKTLSHLDLSVININHIGKSIQYISENLSLTRRYFQNLISLIEIYRQQETNPAPKIKQFIQEIDLEQLLQDLPKTIDLLQAEIKWIQDGILQQSFKESR